MNIAIFTETYTPQINGVVVSIETFKTELEKQGHKVFVLCPDYNRKTGDAPNIRRVFSIPYPWKAMKEQRFCVPFPWDIKGFKDLAIDIIHAQVTASSTSFFALAVGRIFHIPVVHTYHTLFIEYVHYTPLPRELARIGVKLLSRFFCNACERIVVPSKRVTRELRSYGVKRPLDVIPTGMDKALLRDVHPFKREDYGIPRNRAILTFIGRSAKEKNIPFLFRVIDILIKKGADVHLVLIGDGPERQNLEKESRVLGLSERVTFTGYLSRRNVLSLLEGTALFTSCSMTETQGIVILEALACGVPVVAIDAMGVKDILEDGRGGSLVPPSAELFAEKILTYLGDKEMYKKTSGEAKVKSDYWSSENTAGMLLESYKTAVRDYRNRKKRK